MGYIFNRDLVRLAMGVSTVEDGPNSVRNNIIRGMVAGAGGGGVLGMGCQWLVGLVSRVCL